jgi:hypothetical protein
LAELYTAMREGADRVDATQRALATVREASALNTAFDADAAISESPESMVRRYSDQFYAADAAHYEVLGVEVTFNVPIAPGVRFIGAIDALLRDRSTGQVVVMEHKTTGSDTSSFDARFEVDPQTPGYVWAVSQRAKATGRVELNAIRRHGPREPKVNKDGRVSTAACDTTQDVYRAALARQASSVTQDQADFCLSLPTSLDRWLARHGWSYSDVEIARWHSDAVADIELIKRARKGALAASRNGSACANPWQPRCDMRDACVMGPPPASTLSRPDSIYTIRPTTNGERIARLNRK